MIRDHDAYIRAAIDGEVANLATAVEGTRNQTLFKCSARLAGLGVREGEILHHLRPVAESIGLRGRELYSTLKSGVRAGNTKPREMLNRPPAPLQSRPSTSEPDASFIRGEVLPPFGDEVRRHEYRREGSLIRTKIKRRSGAYMNWYKVERHGQSGWQSRKPSNYVDWPYIGVIDPFRSDSCGPVYWPEGEKDCDTLGQHGLPAFTFGGTGDGLPRGVEPLLDGRDIVVLADNDSGGVEHALKKAAVAYRVARSVKVVEFPELGPKEDVSDYLVHASAADLQSRVQQSPIWEPASVEEEPAGWRSSTISAHALKDKKFNPIKYVVPGYIPEGVTIFAGKPKIGKSWLLLDVCLASASGRFVLGSIKPAQGDVLYLALEDSERRLKKRLQKLWPDGAWPANLTLATAWRKADAGGTVDIEDWCASAKNPVLIVVDTLEKLRPAAKANSGAYSSDYLAVEGLHKLAHARGVAVVLIHHLRKMEADDPFDMVSGTNGLTGAADTILVLKRQSGNVTLYARGRDIDEKESACRFDKDTCRWTLLGEAAEVHNSHQRAAILEAIQASGEDGMHTSEIMLATQRTDRNAVDQLLFRMMQDRQIERIKKAVYRLSDKIDKKVRRGE